jgi:general nucleoside transport system permease protein
MRFERREHVPVALALAAPFGAVLAAAAICSVLVAAAHAPVLPAYAALVDGAFGSRLAITETLTRATPIILTGLAAAVAFRSRFWNIGAEGQFYAAATAVAAVGSHELGVPPLLLIPLLLAIGALAGAALLAGPAALKVRLGVDEVVTTLLLNFIVLLAVSMMIEGPMKDPLAFGWPQSVPLVDEALLPKLVPRSRLHLGFLVALAAAGAIALVNARTVFGFESRAVGLNAEAARFAGIPVPGVLMRVGLLSGGLAGLGGALEVAGLKGYVTLDLSPGFGMTGIIVAMLAGLRPIAVVPAAIFVAGLFVGADAMGRAYRIPGFIADVILAVALLAMLVALLLTGYRIRR